ncbi:hypothetical protein [uncultured Nocardioides sp.]|uniref:hypothetical protein n=1 Tax=uncultured Nocardioides sp. TaxID=198441 RepID=UPI0025E1131F|nr:hypothetical protein [uncultured Nocardioides sp.]
MAVTRQATRPRTRAAHPRVVEPLHPHDPGRRQRHRAAVTPADPASRATRALISVPRIAGRPKAPVLSLHGLGDLFVPFSMEQAYARDVARHGRGHLLVQRAIRTVNHCEFSRAEVGTAWNALARWVESRRGPGKGHGSKRHVKVPVGDDVLDPAVVATETYGCRFSGRARTGTRALFAACPSR